MLQPVFFRLATLSIAATLTVLGAHVFLRLTGDGGLTLIDLLRTALVAFSGFWLVWGSAAAILGVFRPVRLQSGQSTAAPQGITAILVPIYNEDPIATFSRIAAMNRSLVDLGVSHKFHFVILSDTQIMETAAQEVVWFNHLIEEPDAIGRIFYRRRDRNIGRKAGNIEDFIARSGAAYDYALILDADSLMEGVTIAAMAHRMDGDARLGLLQSVPHVIHARTIFGRSLQFASTYLSPTFARGAAVMAGHEGPYWGHNAMVRMRAFASCCGLPVLSGKPPFGGHILSHDDVEAALLSRAGWNVIMDPSMPGSYEEGPENLIEYAKRDRRWCQGNLQHTRLVGAPGLKIWSRFTFIQGIMAYAASPLWLLLLAASVIAAVFPNMPTAMPGFININFSAWTLIMAVAIVLLLPKFAILSRGMFDGHNRRFGGTLRSLASVLCEIIISTLLAPTLLLLQTRSVLQVLLGLDGGWPATTRGQNWVDLKTAFSASWWIVAIAVLTLGGVQVFAPASAIWVAPAMVPAILAPFLISLTSRPTRNPGTPFLFATNSELNLPAVVKLQRAIFAAWTVQGSAQEGGLVGMRTGQHVPA